ncbi:MAG: hypothetical protein ACRC7G_14420 [Beijerinckiaceae bacterium]
MTFQSSAVSRPRGKSFHRRLERIEMRVLVALTFPLFLIVAIANRLGLRRSSFAAVTAITPRSVFAEARMTAEATIPSAFRG